MRATFLLLAYNQQDYVALAVRAALAQIGEPLLIFISDDASTDDTFAVIKATVAGYDGPHWVVLNCNPRNLGIAAHINAAMGQITTEYVIAAAGDDISAPDRSQRLLDCFDSSGALLVHSRCQDIDRVGNIVDTALGHNNAKFFGNTSAEDLAMAMDLYIGATGAWHRELFQRFGDISRGCYEDLILGYRAALLNRVAMVDAALVRYRVGVGISASPAAPKSVVEWQRLRLKELELRKAVYEQRLFDITCAVRPDLNLVVDKLKLEIQKDTLRISCYRSSPTSFLNTIIRSTPIVVKTLASEWNKKRRVRRAINRLMAQKST